MSFCVSTSEKIQPLIRPCITIEPFFTSRIPLWKRVVDILGALIGLTLFAPMLLFIYVTIKVVSPGPVLFRQERLGYGGKKFNIFKFRTMEVNSDSSEHKQYLRELIRNSENAISSGKPMIKRDNVKNSQIIPFGRILRKSCLDELPQLINVLLGEMSLVGPRPPIPYEVAEYTGWHNGRFDALPGMTGLWQVSGKNRLTFQEMVRLDIQYARNVSLQSDIKILMKTPLAVISEVMYSREKALFTRRSYE